MNDLPPTFGAQFNAGAMRHILPAHQEAASRWWTHLVEKDKDEDRAKTLKRVFQIFQQPFIVVHLLFDVLFEVRDHRRGQSIGWG